MGQGSIRVLLVEDDRADQMAVERLVKKEGLPYDLVIAETVAEAIARLKEGRLDLALIDYRLPDGSGLEVQEHVGDTPCIFITGAANQAVAVQAMKAGAFDFLIKDQARDYLQLLPVTIENAIHRKQDEDELRRYREHLEEMVEQRTAQLREANEQLHAEIAERRRAGEALRESEARFRVLTEYALAGVYLVQDDRFRYVNPALAAMFGYTPEELIGRLGSLDLTSPEDRDRVIENVRQRIEEGVESTHYTFRGLRKDGTLFECEVLGSVAEYAGRPAVLGMVLDITERVRAEQTMQRQTWELVTLNQIGRALSQLAPTDEILHQIYVAIGQVLSNDNLYIALYDELDGRLSFPVYTIEGQLRDPGISRPFGNGITEYVIRTKAPLCILSDLQETLVELGVDLIGHPSSSLLAVPILFGEKVLGVIALQDYQNENTYTSGDVSLLSNIASQAAIAIENARLHENVQRELSRRKQAERTLQQIVEGTSSVVGEEFLRSLVKHLASMLQTRFAFLSKVVDPEGKRVALTAFWDGADYGECFEYDIEGTPCEQVVSKNLAFFPDGVQELFPDDLWLKEAEIVSYLAIPLFDSVGNALGHLGVMHDAPMQESYLARSTLEIFAARAVAELERKRAQDALRMAGQRYRDLFEEAPVMYVITRDQAGVPIVADCNQLFLDTLGFDKTQVLGRPLADFYTPESRAELLEGGGYQRALEGQFGAEERNLLTRDGRVVVALLRALPETDFAGQVSGTRATYVDITKRRQAETALKEYSERLEEMVEERTRNLREAQEQLVRREKLVVLGQLAGGVAHELRSPLGAISNAAYFLNLVLEEPPPAVKETLEILGREVRTSEKIISSLLDYARTRPPIRQAVNVNALVQEALSRAGVPANIQVMTNLDETLPAIQADPDQLEQVFDNLIRNAVQAMPAGGQLSVISEQLSVNSDQSSVISEQSPIPSTQSPISNLQSLDRDRSPISISFTDTGVGIPPENLDKLFEPLFTTKAKGIGLGLALCKMLVEGNGGIIEAESEVGAGSTFTVKLIGD